MNARAKNNAPERLVWIDLEMTGLDVEACAIIQAAMIITDFDLNELASVDVTIWQPEATLLQVSPVVKSIHSNNGLLKRVRASDHAIFEAEHKLMEVLSEHVSYQRGYLAGNSVYVDRGFLKKYMPMVEGYLHYRQLDVSSFKMVCQEWLKMQAPKKESTHTALEDIQQSIEELKFLRKECFKQP
ncbi:MAG: oligoribonuclease [Deltaproteobacteria bacterium]|nr:oligoribonuclease [Deltaproteobacteria bacterium]